MKMDILPVTLRGEQVRLESLSRTHQAALFAAASDGSLWESKVTFIPETCDAMGDYIGTALTGQARGLFLPFVIVQSNTDRVVGTTRYLNIDPAHHRLEIGATWLAAGAQRTVINTEAKYLLLRHAFEKLDCFRVSFVTDVLNGRSRQAILRLGAKFEGILRCHMVMPDGRRRDSACYSIVEAEWPGVRGRLESMLKGKTGSGALSGKGAETIESRTWARSELFHGKRNLRYFIQNGI